MVDARDRQHLLQFPASDGAAVQNVDLEVTSAPGRLPLEGLRQLLARLHDRVPPRIPENLGKPAKKILAWLHASPRDDMGLCP